MTDLTQSNNSNFLQSSGRKYRVLIADDEEDARTLIGVALDRPSLELLFAKDGIEALSICEKELPDLAIVDIQMPGKSGIEVCQWIKGQSSKVFVPVLILTSQSETYDKVKGLSFGADDYITKPFSFAELAARVEAFLRIKSLTEQLAATRNLLEEKEKELVAIQVAGAAAHELGQPLTSILLHCELLQSLSDQPEKIRETIRSINSECKRVRDTISRLNSLERFRLKSYTEDLQILDLGEEVK